jgi:hypothetical protein
MKCSHVTYWNEDLIRAGTDFDLEAVDFEVPEIYLLIDGLNKVLDFCQNPEREPPGHFSAPFYRALPEMCLVNGKSRALPFGNRALIV